MLWEERSSSKPSSPSGGSRLNSHFRLLFYTFSCCDEDDGIEVPAMYQTMYSIKKTVLTVGFLDGDAPLDLSAFAYLSS